MHEAWFRTHVRKKCWETFSPFLTNFDAATAIVFEPLNVRVLASLDDVFPASIFRGLVSRVSVSKVASAISVTSATLNDPVANDMTIDFFCNAAFAAKQKPPDAQLLIERRSDLAKNGQFIEGFADHVDACHPLNYHVFKGK